MKVLALVIFAFASASGRGSGPYLPSGWRPEGPAFYLPSEIVKLSAIPRSDLNLQGSEASGSDFLQEYGPPKVQEISQNIINQGLPDVAIEQNFDIVAQNVLSDIATEKIEGVSYANVEVVTTEATVIESQSLLDENPPISAELPILDFVVQEATVSNIEQTTELASQADLNEQDSLQSTVLSELDAVTSSVADNEKPEVSFINVVPATVQPSEQNLLQNIPDIIASLEQEALTQQVESNQSENELTSIQGVSGSLEQIPEGFLEYGPPGFAEYGPPKEDQEETKKLQNTQLNETRRRRFSPKFRSAKRQ